MQIGFVLDIIIVVLLVLTIVYAVRLNQRLSQLRSDKNELLALVKTFAEATTKAESGIGQLKISSESLRAEVKKAEALRDDLAYLVERGGRTADQMVASVRAPATAKSNDEEMVGGDDDQLIEDAIRAAASSVESAPKPIRRGARADQPRGGARDAGEDFGATTRRISGHFEPLGESLPEPSHPARLLGGGLGGVRAEDRLLDDRDYGDDAPKTVGDTDAARELLKALRSVK